MQAKQRRAMEHMLRQMDVKKNVLLQVRNRAAKLIQKISRGFIARVRYANRHWAVILLQVTAASSYFIFIILFICFILVYLILLYRFLFYFYSGQRSNFNFVVVFVRVLSDPTLSDSIIKHRIQDTESLTVNP